MMRVPAYLRALRGVGALIAVIMLPLPANAQQQNNLAAEIAAVSQALSELETKWEANNASVSRADLDVWSKRAAGSGDLKVILRFYQLFTAIGQRDGNVLSVMGGRVHVSLARHAIDGALTSTVAIANFELGQAFLAQTAFRDAGQFALMNALSVANAFMRSGMREPEIIGVQAMSNALLGQSLLQAGRPGAAVYYLGAAQAQANGAGFSEGNKTGVGNLLKQAQAGANAIAPLDGGDVCDTAAAADEKRRSACLAEADRLWSRKNVTGAEDILVRLAGPFTCMSLGEGRLEIVQRLMFLRALRQRPGQPVLRDPVCAVANQIAPRRPIAASALAMPTIRAYVEQGQYDTEVAELTAHIARRWIRENQDLFAWYFMEALSAYIEKGKPPGNLQPRTASDLTREQKLAQSLIALDRAYIAERSGWAAAGESERARALASADAIGLEDIDQLNSDLRKYWTDSYGFMIPTPAAAAEFYARVARRLPLGAERRRTAFILWPGLEHAHRADSVRAARIAGEVIEQLRRDGEAERITLAILLDIYADIVRYANPQAADSALREALAIYIAEPGTETSRLEVMLKLEQDRRRLGDVAGAERFFAEATTLRNTASGLDESIVALFDMRQATRLLDDDKNAQAIALAEKSMERIEAATADSGADWARVSPASTLALIYARTGQVDRARDVYKTHILSWATPAKVGEALALNARMSLASLEALYGPNPETVKTLQEILGNATRRAAGARELQEAGWRWLSFAHLGVGQYREALLAARRSASLKPPQGAETDNSDMDRRLAETHVAAAWRAVR